VNVAINYRPNERLSPVTMTEDKKLQNCVKYSLWRSDRHVAFMKPFYFGLTS